MKVLARHWNSGDYVWLDAEYNEGIKNFTHEGIKVEEANIVSVFEDNRDEFVRCSICGKTFKKGDPEIELHTKPVTDTSKCFGCSYLRSRVKEYGDPTYEHIEGNRYKESHANEVELTCTITYPQIGIHEERARTRCVFNRCVEADIIGFSDFFTEHPEAFDDIITTEKVEEFGCSETYRTGNVIEYKLNCRNNVWAVANPLGIIDRFIINYRRDSYTTYYSKKYNKLYTSIRGRYTEWNPFNMPESSKTLILNKIAALYS